MSFLRAHREVTEDAMLRIKEQDVMESYEDDEPEDMQEMFALTLVLHMIATQAKQNGGDDLLSTRLIEIHEKTEALLSNKVFLNHLLKII